MNPPARDPIVREEVVRGPRRGMHGAEAKKTCLSPGRSDRRPTCTSVGTVRVDTRPSSRARCRCSALQRAPARGRTRSRSRADSRRSRSRPRGGRRSPSGTSTSRGPRGAPSVRRVATSSPGAGCIRSTRWWLPTGVRARRADRLPVRVATDAVPPSAAVRPDDPTVRIPGGRLGAAALVARAGVQVRDERSFPACSSRARSASTPRVTSSPRRDSTRSHPSYRLKPETRSPGPRPNHAPCQQGPDPSRQGERRSRSRRGLRPLRAPRYAH